SIHCHASGKNHVNPVVSIVAAPNAKRYFLTIYRRSICPCGSHPVKKISDPLVAARPPQVH
ncbi:MAG: hypothetical protein JW936_00005, partial [Sedimentisphaerales bacterium]|nr:hypothetical protein [Sedimentisphaerales bacterium]